MMCDNERIIVTLIDSDCITYDSYYDILWLGIGDGLASRRWSFLEFAFNNLIFMSSREVSHHSAHNIYHTTQNTWFSLLFACPLPARLRSACAMLPSCYTCLNNLMPSNNLLHNICIDISRGNYHSLSRQSRACMLLYISRLLNHIFILLCIGYQVNFATQ